MKTDQYIELAKKVEKLGRHLGEKGAKAFLAEVSRYLRDAGQERRQLEAIRRLYDPLKGRSFIYIMANTEGRNVDLIVRVFRHPNEKVVNDNYLTKVRNRIEQNGKECGVAWQHEQGDENENK